MVIAEMVGWAACEASEENVLFCGGSGQAMGRERSERGECTLLRREQASDGDVGGRPPEPPLPPAYCYRFRTYLLLHARDLPDPAQVPLQRHLGELLAKPRVRPDERRAALDLRPLAVHELDGVRGLAAGRALGD
jgi:hypothetical protein